MPRDRAGRDRRTSADTQLTQLIRSYFELLAMPAVEVPISFQSSYPSRSIVRGVDVAASKDDAGVHLYLEGPDAAVNHALLEQLQAHRSEIEAAFGSPLEWDHQEGGRSALLVCG